MPMPLRCCRRLHFYDASHVTRRFLFPRHTLAYDADCYALIAFDAFLSLRYA